LKKSKWGTRTCDTPPDRGGVQGRGSPDLTREKNTAPKKKGEGGLDRSTCGNCLADLEGVGKGEGLERSSGDKEKRRGRR